MDTLPCICFASLARREGMSSAPAPWKILLVFPFSRVKICPRSTG